MLKFKFQMDSDDLFHSVSWQQMTENDSKHKSKAKIMP